MDKPIYARPRSGKRRSRWRTVFIGIVLIQFILLGLYLNQRKEPSIAITAEPTNTPISSLPSRENEVTTPVSKSTTTPVLNDQIQAIQHALSNADVKQAHALIQPYSINPMQQLSI